MLTNFDSLLIASIASHGQGESGVIINALSWLLFWPLEIISVSTIAPRIS